MKLCSRNCGPQLRVTYADDPCAGRPCDPHLPAGAPVKRPTAGVGLGQQGPSGRMVSPGVYFCSIQTPTGRLSVRALVLR